MLLKKTPSNKSFNIPDGRIRKFTKLNFNLKIEIFSFVSFEEKINKLFLVCKAFSFALNQTKIIKFLKQNFDYLLSQVDFRFDTYKNLKTNFSIFQSLDEGFFLNIFIYLLNHKHMNTQEIFYDDYSNNYSYNDKKLFCQFLKVNKTSNFKIKIFNKSKENEEIHSLFEAISVNHNVEYLKFFILQGFSESDFSLLANSLENKNQLKVLDLSFIYFMENEDKKSFEVLFRGLKKNKTLKTLLLGGSEIGIYNPKDIFYLSEYIKSNDSLEELELKGNYNLSRNKDFALHIAEIFNASKPNLKYVNLDTVTLNCYKSDLRPIFESLGKNNTLLKLKISDNFIGESLSNFLSFCNFLKDNQTLEILDSLRNSIGKSIDNQICDLSYFFQCLGLNKSLKILNLSSNFIAENPQNFICLCEYLQENNTVEQLDISNNLINEEKNNLSLLSKALIKNKTLKNIYLNRNAIKNVEFLAEILMNNHSLIKLNVSYNEISDENIKYIHSLDYLNRVVF